MVNFGLVIEGGGTKTAYTGGVLKALLDNKIYAPYGCGISAGAEFLLAYASGQADRLEATAVEAVCSKEVVGIRPFIKEGSVFGLDATCRIINDLAPLDMDYLMNSPTKFETGLYNLKTHEIEYFDQTSVDEDELLIKASCALLLLCKPIHFNGSEYMDAGLVEMIPIHRSIEVGCEKHLVISCKEEGYVRHQAPGYQTFLANMVYHDDKITDDLRNRHVRYNEQWGLVADLEKEGKAMILRPSKDMGISRYTTDASKLRPWFKLGYDETIERLDEIKKFLEIE